MRRRIYAHAAGRAAARSSARFPPEARAATLVVDALLGTGVSGPATGRMLQGIREINRGFPLAKVVAVDIPSGMPSDSGEPAGEFARADYTVTFTAPKVVAGHAAELRPRRGTDRRRHRQPARAVRGRAALAGGAGDVPRTAGAARPGGPQGHLRARAGRRGLARQDRRGGDGRDGRAARGRGPGDRGLGRKRHRGDRRRMRRS